MTWPIHCDPRLHRKLPGFLLGDGDLLGWLNKNFVTVYSVTHVYKGKWMQRSFFPPRCSWRLAGEPSAVASIREKGLETHPHLLHLWCWLIWLLLSVRQQLHPGPSVKKTSAMLDLIYAVLNHCGHKACKASINQNLMLLWQTPIPSVETWDKSDNKRHFLDCLCLPHAYSLNHPGTPAFKPRPRINAIYELSCCYPLLLLPNHFHPSLYICSLTDSSSAIVPIMLETDFQYRLYWTLNYYFIQNNVWEVWV